VTGIRWRRQASEMRCRSASVGRSLEVASESQEMV
jgi:hypothetical protein